MNFHLQFPIHPYKEKINYRQSLVFMGSCFAENIGDIMEMYKFNTLINPCGIAYNPASIAISLRKFISGYQMPTTELFSANEVWNSWEHSGERSGIDKSLTCESMNYSYSTAHNVLKSADWLFITFGSAHYYKRVENGQIVSNCHKVPQKEFTKHLLSVEEIVTDYTEIVSQLKELNPALKLVFTVSPVRYKRDGVVENNRSKARLIEAVHQLTEQNDKAYYFPAYELVIDDLRDYRFFKEDLVHPSSQAIQYVFEKLKEAIFDDETNAIFMKIQQLVSDQNHHVLHPDTPANIKFTAGFNNRWHLLKKEFPFIALDDEI